MKSKVSFAIYITQYFRLQKTYINNLLGPNETLHSFITYSTLCASAFAKTDCSSQNIIVYKLGCNKQSSTRHCSFERKPAGGTYRYNLLIKILPTVSLLVAASARP